MQKHSSIVILLVVFFCGLSVPTFAQTEKQLQDQYLEYLQKNEIEGFVDADGDIQFKFEGRSYFIEVDENDTEFFRLVLANIWPIESEKERVQVLRAVDVANNKVKVAKIYTVKDNVWVGVEVFRDEFEDYETYFERSLKVISRCIEYFVEEMEG